MLPQGKLNLVYQENASATTRSIEGYKVKRETIAGVH